MSRTIPAFLFGADALTFTIVRRRQKLAPETNRLRRSNLVGRDVVLAEAGGMEIADGGTPGQTHRQGKERDDRPSHGLITQDETLQLTRPAFCPSATMVSDGKYIAFLSSRGAKSSKRDGGDDKDDDKTQVWLINHFGGEPWPLTDSPRDIRTFAWQKNDAILYAAQEKKTKRESELKEKKDTAQVIDDEPNEPPVRLWKVDAKEKKSERVSDNSDRIQSVAVSPDGKWAVTIHERSLSYAFDHRVKPAVYLCDLVQEHAHASFQRSLQHCQGLLAARQQGVFTRSTSSRNIRSI